jgi:hypothetical protein
MFLSQQKELESVFNTIKTKMEQGAWRIPRCGRASAQDLAVLLVQSGPTVEEVN